MSPLHAVLALVAAVAAAPDDHARPDLSPAEEQAWLDALVAASPHAALWQQMPPDPPPAPGAAAEPGLPPPLGAPTKAAWPAKPGRRVFGYLPYWTKDSAYLPWKELTQVAWFSAGIAGSGQITSLAGWNGAASKDFIAKAHGHGVQVVLTFTQFGTSAISAIVKTPESRKIAVANIVATVVQGGGDGCNIDFEGLAKADREPFKAFIALLQAELQAALPGADLTMATPAVDWSSAWDYQYLAEHSDGLLIMAYAIHWGGGAPGPQLPMAAQKPWTHKTLQWVIDDYLKYAKPQNLDKIIVGLPLYGMAWPSDSPGPGAKALGKGSSVTYAAGQVGAPKAGGWKWDVGSQSSYYVAQSGVQWVQTWVDNLKAFEMRVDYLDAKDTHMGLWALGYANGQPEVWSAIAAWQKKGGPPVVADPAADAGSTDLGKDVDAGAAADSAVKDGGGDAKDSASAASDLAEDGDAGDGAESSPADADSGPHGADSGAGADSAPAETVDAATTDLTIADGAPAPHDLADTAAAGSDLSLAGASDADSSPGAAGAATTAAGASSCAASGAATAPPWWTGAVVAAAAALVQRRRRSA